MGISFWLKGVYRQLIRTTQHHTHRRHSRNSTLSAQVELLETRRLLAGMTVGPNVNISQLAGNQDESAIIVNPNNSQQLFASSNTASGLFAARSNDGGVTWLPSNGADFLIIDDPMKPEEAAVTAFLRLRLGQLAKESRAA